MAAVSEEKVSPDSQAIFKEKEHLKSANVDNNEVKTDAMLDEIAAKVEALDFSKIQEDEDGNDFHAKCMETVKRQGETINTLVQQLRVMFDEYQAIDREREYYEDLNDALIRCLELTEGKIQFDDDSEESDKEETEEEDITRLVSKESEELCISQEEEKKKEKGSENSSTETKKEVGAVAADAIKKEGGTTENESTQTGVKTFAKSELIRLNRILLCEIFELRHQIDVMKANIRDYFEDTEGSDYDTATDDEHICEHCAPPATRHDVTANKEEAENYTVENKNDNEEYEILENEEDMKIKNESDTE